jgi:hypothetical protein
MSTPPTRGRWVAIVTGAISILIAVAYLALITVLDSRGPLQPPPPEALGLLPGSGAIATSDVSGASGAVAAAAVSAPAVEAPPHG